MTLADIAAMLDKGSKVEEKIEPQVSQETEATPDTEEAPAENPQTIKFLAGEVATLRQQLEVAKLRIDAATTRAQLVEKCEASNGFRKTGFWINPSISHFQDRDGDQQFRNTILGKSLPEMLELLDVFNGHIQVLRELIVETQAKPLKDVLDEARAEKVKVVATSAERIAAQKVKNDKRVMSPKEKFFAQMKKIGMSDEMIEAAYVASGEGQ